MSLGLTLVAAVLLAGCPSKEAKLEALRQDCLGFCGKCEQVIELCAKFCKGGEVENCGEVYCTQPKENAAECKSCCEEKGALPGFVLGSCLSHADMSEAMTAQKKWEIWKKIVDQRRTRETKEQDAKVKAEQIAALDTHGWTLTSEKGDDGSTASILVKEGAAIDGAEEKPKLLLRCSAGNAELYLQTAVGVQAKGGKLKGKLALDGAAASPLALTVAADDDTLAVDEAAALLSKLASAKKLSIELKAKTGGALSLSIDLAGLDSGLGLIGKDCGL